MGVTAVRGAVLLVQERVARIAVAVVVDAQEVAHLVVQTVV